MMQKLNVQRIGAGTFFKLLMIGLLFTHLLATVVVMACIPLGIFSPIENEVPISILNAELYLVGYLLLGALLVPLWAGIFWLSIYPGIWVYSIKRSMSIRFKEPEAQAPDT